MSNSKKTSAKTNDNLNISKDDFESPVVFKKFKPSNDNINTKRAKNKKKKSNKQLTLHQVYQDNFKYSDVDPEQLQLALALSRSISEIHNECSTREEFPLASQNDGRKKTLLEFGFRTNKPKINVENKMLRKEPLKTNKKSKFRFITPILMMRTDEERKYLVESKLTKLISEKAVDSYYIRKGPPEVSCEEIKKIRCMECSIFFFDQRNLSSEKEHFLVPYLNIEGSRAKTGSLLKDWTKIPLRDHTPERSKIEISYSVENSKISETKPLEEDESRIILPSNKMCDFELEQPQPEGKAEIKNHSSNSQLSVQYYEAPVSPDLFDSDYSLSENQSLSLSDNSSRNSKKNLENIFTLAETVHETALRKQFLLNSSHFEDKGHKMHLEKTIEQENKNCSYHNSVEFSKHEYEYHDNGSDENTKKAPEIFLPVSSMSKNETQNLEPQSKGWEESSKCNGFSNLHTVIVSSDEEFSASENSFSKAKRSLKVVKKFDEGLDPLFIEKNDPDVTIDLKISDRILQTDRDNINSKSRYCIDDDEDMDGPLNISDIVNSAKKKYSNEISSSNEERMEHWSDSLKKLSEKYNNLNNSSFDTSLKKSNSFQFDALRENNLSEGESSNSSHYFDSKKGAEENKNNQRKLGGDNFADIILSSDEENFNIELDGKFSNSKNDQKTTKNDLQGFKGEKTSLKITEKVEEQSYENKKLLDDNTDDFEMPERMFSPDSDNNIESENIHFMDDIKMVCPLNISNIVNKVKKKYSDENISYSSATKIEHSSETPKQKKLSEKYKNIDYSFLDVSLEKSNNAKFSSLVEHNLSERLSSDSFCHLKSSEFDENRELSDKCSVDSPNFSNEFGNFVDNIILSSDGENSKSEIDGKFTAPNIKSLDVLCNSPMDYCSKRSNMIEFELSQNLNHSDKCTTVNAKKPEEISDNFSESLLDHFFEGNFYSIQNNSSESKEIDNSVKSHFRTGECSNLKSPKINNEDEYSNVKSRTPLRRYTSFTVNSTPSKITNFSKHKSDSNITPKRKFFVKTTNITPMTDYNAFSTPEIVQELGKFGLKPLKRKRGINLLKHIYETTHPKVEVRQTDEKILPILKRRRSDESQKIENLNKKNIESEVLTRWSGTISESEAIFERQRSSKLPTCQAPLQIVWHNFLNENPKILENILLYEPLQVEVIHKMLKELGYKFHLQDLITFLDQKCITIRVAQTQQIKVK